MPDSLQDKI